MLKARLSEQRHVPIARAILKSYGFSQPSTDARVVRSLQSSLQAVSVYERKTAGAAEVVRTKRA